MVSQIGNSTYSYEALSTGKTSTAQSSFPSIHAFLSDEYESAGINAFEYLTTGAVQTLTKANSFESYKAQEISKLKTQFVAKNTEEVASLSREEFLQRMNTLNDKIDSIDFEQGYQDYMQSRGCKNEQELKILNSCWIPCNTMDDYLNYASSCMSNVNCSLAGCGLISQSYATMDFKSMLKDIDLTEIQNYLYKTQISESFMDRVSAFQSFAQNASAQEGASSAFSEIASAIEGAKDEIKILSDKIEEQNKQFRAQDKQNNNQKYNEKLIAHYQN